MEKRDQKRLIIIAVYLVLFCLVALAIYYAFKPQETCFDKVKNQNEENVDCGGVCAPCRKIAAQPLATGEAGIVPGGVSGQYDFYGVVTNPNNIYGSNNFEYKITLKDASGNILEERTGNSYILPGDRKYIVETNFKPASAPASYEFNVSDPSWVEFTTYYEKPDITVVNKRYNEISNGVGFSETTGLLKNETPFDFTLIKIQVILRDAGGKVVALNSTEMNTVKSKEERDFRAFWPNRFPGAVNDVEAQVEVNVFNSQSFIKKYLEGSMK